MTEKPPMGEWFKSSRSAQANECVEVFLGDHLVGVRDTADHGSGPELWFTAEQWDAFLTGDIWRS
ncbi:DUF397 domain-containing protein [Nocardia sp. NPDC020380]|uniref:DUF397 domain-containing protein n=1 Tax=Nocardia sp. NPDC020380 TaxID=3364309 RepID=UPI00378E12A2